MFKGDNELGQDGLFHRPVNSPFLLSVMVNIGVDPLHFAAVVGTSGVIGCNSPPRVPILFMTCRIGNVGMSQAVCPAISHMAFAALSNSQVLACRKQGS